MSDLQGVVALVSGGWAGIGRAIVERLRQRGARVAFTWLPGSDPIDQITAYVSSDPLWLSAHPLDLRQQGAARACVASVADHWGGLDVLINNAALGSGTVGQITTDPDEQDALLLGVNAAGTLGMCRAFLQSQPTGPMPRRIINISSVGGGIASFPAFNLADGMSKAAIAHLTRQLAAQATHSPLDVVAICPGATETAMFEASTLSRMPPAEREAFLATLPNGRLIQPAEIADLVCHLAGPLATLLSGAVIDASMGLGVRPGLMTEAYSSSNTSP